MLTLDLNIVWTIVNLIVLYLLLRKFLFKPVLAMMEKRETLIKEGLENAQHEREEAQMLMHEAQERLDATTAEAESQVKLRHEQSERHHREIIAEARREAEQIVAGSRRDAAAEREKILNESRDELIAAAMDAVRCAARFGTDAGGDHQLFQELVQEVEGSHGRD